MDVLCVGTAAYDLVFQVPYHPGADEKIVASSLGETGGGPAANAAVAVARLGFTAAFAGYLGHDHWGDENLRELANEGVITDLIARGTAPTPLSAILVKPGGRRTVVNFPGRETPLAAEAIDFNGITPKAILFDGHEPLISPPLARRAREIGIPTILDAGSVRPGTVELVDLVDYAICSSKFARDFTGKDDEDNALQVLADHAPFAAITLGESGLVWATGGESGALPAFPVEAVDTTGAGDAFHGAFAAGIATKMDWKEALRYASAVAALSCTRPGARPSLPTGDGVNAYLHAYDINF